MQWILQFLQHRGDKLPARTALGPEEAAAAAAVAAAIGATGSKEVSVDGTCTRCYPIMQLPCHTSPNSASPACICLAPSLTCRLAAGHATA